MVSGMGSQVVVVNNNKRLTNTNNRHVVGGGCVAWSRLWGRPLSGTGHNELVGNVGREESSRDAMSCSLQPVAGRR